MRIIIAGSPALRARLRERLLGLQIEIAAEFPTIGLARASGIAADGILVAGDRPPFADGEAAVDEPLTARELQVLELLGEGLSNRGIARRLGISDQTVKFHVSSVLAKLGASNRTDAVRRAARRGLIAL
jgi:DNA-binding NarL/FixJ family response regulator